MKRKVLMTALVAVICSLALAQGKTENGNAFRVACVFTDHMVLQRETSAPVWGWAEAGTKVTVEPSWDGKKYSATAGPDGRWEVKVATPGAGGTPRRHPLPNSREAPLCAPLPLCVSALKIPHPKVQGRFLAQRFQMEFLCYCGGRRGLRAGIQLNQSN